MKHTREETAYMIFPLYQLSAEVFCSLRAQEHWETATTKGNRPHTQENKH